MLTSTHALTIAGASRQLIVNLSRIYVEIRPRLHWEVREACFRKKMNSKKFDK